MRHMPKVDSLIGIHIGTTAHGELLHLERTGGFVTGVKSEHTIDFLENIYPQHYSTRHQLINAAPIGH